MIRRTKEEVNIDIPNCMQTILYHGINNLQKKLYRAILLKNYGIFFIFYFFLFSILFI